MADRRMISLVAGAPGTTPSSPERSQDKAAVGTVARDVHSAGTTIIPGCSAADLAEQHRQVLAGGTAAEQKALSAEELAGVTLSRRHLYTAQEYAALQRGEVQTSLGTFEAFEAKKEQP